MDILPIELVEKIHLKCDPPGFLHFILAYRPIAEHAGAHWAVPTTYIDLFIRVNSWVDRCWRAGPITRRYGSPPTRRLHVIHMAFSRKHGKETIETADGALVEEHTYLHGRLHGEQITYDSRGRPNTVTKYVAGERVGVADRWTSGRPMIVDAAAKCV